MSIYKNTPVVLLLGIAGLAVSACGSSNDTPASDQNLSGTDQLASGESVPVAPNAPVINEAPGTPDAPVNTDVPVSADVPLTVDQSATPDSPQEVIPSANQGDSVDTSIDSPSGPNVSDAPADDVPIDFSQTEEPEASPGSDVIVEVPAETPPTNSVAPNDNNPPLSDIDLSGGDDDSPTQTESLSLSGPFIEDKSRSAGPPSVPTGLTPLVASDNWIEFSWAPSADDQSVTAYEIYRDGRLIATVRGDTGNVHDYRSWITTSFIDCNYTRYANCSAPELGLQPQTGASYSYSIAAVDNEGMRSEQSDPVIMSMATPQQSPVDLTGYTRIFNEEFDQGTIDRNRWKTSLPWGADTIINRESQYFVNLFGSNNQVTYNPFEFTGDTLKINGIRTPADQLAAANNQPYLSGVLTTADYFFFTYGYVEMRAKLASGSGMLSTFFLFNQDYEKNSPELDIIEYKGAEPTVAYQTYHYYDSNRTNSPRGEKHSSPTMATYTNQNLSDDFHTYSMLWEPGLAIWYIDGVEVRRIEGVRVSDEPMNIVTQLVMGSEWIGEPDPSAVPATLEIDYVRAYQR